MKVAPRLRESGRFATVRTQSYANHIKPSKTHTINCTDAISTLSTLWLGPASGESSGLIAFDSLKLEFGAREY